MFDVTPITSAKHLDCGATCLAMLLTFSGQEANLEELTEECNTRMIGCSGADLLRVGRAHGMDMTAWQMDAAEVVRQDRPAICHWRHTHWIVCCGRNSRGEVVICNPDLGRFALDEGSFAVLYSGVALFNGEPETLPEPEPDETEDLAEAARILMGVNE